MNITLKGKWLLLAVFIFGCATGPVVNKALSVKDALAKSKKKRKCQYTYIKDSYDPNIAEDGQKPEYGDNWKKLINDGWRLHTVKGKEVYIWEKCIRA